MTFCKITKISYVRVRRQNQNFFLWVPSNVHDLQQQQQSTTHMMMTDKDDESGHNSSVGDYLKQQILLALSRFENDEDDMNPDDDDDEDDDHTRNRYHGRKRNSPYPQDIADLRLMDTAGIEIQSVSQLSNDQELHVVFRIEGNDFEPVQIFSTEDAME